MFAESIEWGLAVVAEEGQNKRNIVDILFAVGSVFFIFVGYRFGPYVYPFLHHLYIYNLIKNMWSSFIILGIGILDFFSFTKRWVQWIVGKLQSIHFGLIRVLGYAALIFAYLIFCGVSFVCGAAVLSPDEDSQLYHDGDVIGLDELESSPHIYITIVLEDGSKPQDPDVQYEIICVQPEGLPLWQIAVDFPRYLVRQARGISPIKVTVRSIDDDDFPDVVVRFSDPLISYEAETVMWICNQDLLGDVSMQVHNDYSPTFEYSFDGTVWTSYHILETENQLPIQFETVLLKWDNDWELAHRSTLNHQKISAKAGEIVDFFYPGERIELNLDMINYSKSSECALADKLKVVKQYQLSWESVVSQAVHCNSSITIDSTIAASNLPEQPPCLIKTGMEIIYHCYDGSNDLGYYYIVTDHEAVVWEKARLGQKEAVVLRLDMKLTE